MLGWDIRVYRLPKPGYRPAEEIPKEALCIARWGADVEGTQRLDDLIEQGKAFGYFQWGYPNRYTARALDILPIVRSDPPFRKVYRPLEEFLATLPNSDWKGGFDAAEADACRPDELLVIVVWDES